MIFGVSSRIAANSLPPNARISSREVTGNSPRAEIGPNSNTRVKAAGSWLPAGVSVPLGPPL